MSNQCSESIKSSVSQSISIKDVNIPEIIKSNKYFKQISSIKNYETTLQKTFSSAKDSVIIKNPFIYLWNLDDCSEILPEIMKPDVIDFFGIKTL